MSLLPVTKAVQIAQEAREQREKELENELNADTTKMNERVEDVIRKQDADSKGYYSFEYARKDISFGDKDKVIKRFVMSLKNEGYRDPSVKYHKSLRQSNSYYVVKFALPLPDRVKDS